MDSSCAVTHLYRCKMVDMSSSGWIPVCSNTSVQCLRCAGWFIYFAGKSDFSDNFPLLDANGTANSRFRNPHCILVADHMVLNQATGIIFCPGATSKTSRSCLEPVLIATVTAMTRAR